MKRQVVVDTNVAIVANGGDWVEFPECVDACIERLDTIRKSEVVLLDDGNCILQEYSRKLDFSGRPGVGHAFFKWLWDRQGVPEYCVRVAVTPCAGRGFAEFPDSEDLRGFDRDDRKFVAVAIAAGTGPPVVNATDRGWRKHRQALEREGVVIECLCPGVGRVA